MSDARTYLEQAYRIDQRINSKINQDIDMLVDLKTEIMQVIKKVDDLELQILLEQRYLNFRTWEQIAVDMGYNWNGKQVYPKVAEGFVGGMSNKDCPFLVKVSIPDLYIRKGSGTNTAKTGQCTGIGIWYNDKTSVMH